MKSALVLLGIAIFSLAALLTTGCDILGAGKKSSKIALADLKAVQAIAKVGVNEKDFAIVYERARISCSIALGKLDDGDIKTVLTAASEGYADGKKVLETPGQIDTTLAPFNLYIGKYGFRAPSRYVLQFGLLQKIFDKAGKSTNELAELLK